MRAQPDLFRSSAEYCRCREVGSLIVTQNDWIRGSMVLRERIELSTSWSVRQHVSGPNGSNPRLDRPSHPARCARRSDPAMRLGSRHGGKTDAYPRCSGEALAKLQRGGEQVVKVVHAHPGGQAVIGNVVGNPKGSNGAGGEPRGGGIDEKSNQPHAKAVLPAAGANPLPEVWSSDAAAEAVPVASGTGQVTLQDALRGIR